MTKAPRVLLAAAGLILAAGTPAMGNPLETVGVRRAAAMTGEAYEGTVEAVRQATLAAQVSGAIIVLQVKVGDIVRAGQTLVRIDARAAEQLGGASEALVASHRAALAAASSDVERQRQLYARDYISRAALERAEAQYLSRKAQLEAGIAQADAARTQASWHEVIAPWSGIVAEVPATVGEMAMPGKPLITLIDPTQLRVAVAIPQQILGRPLTPETLSIEWPGRAEAGRTRPARVTILPLADPVTHTVTLRLDLPSIAHGALQPGLFARVWIGGPATRDPAQHLFVPTRAVVRRAELAAVYVVDRRGTPTLRQVRLGPAAGDDVEILAGLSVDDRIAVNPQAAIQAAIQAR